MELDQRIFRAVWKFFERRFAKPVDPARVARAVHLKDVEAKLQTLARALSGAPIALAPAEREGGYRGTTFFLPETFDHFESAGDNARFYVFRVTYLAVQRSLGFAWPDTSEHDLGESRARALHTSRDVLDLLYKELPGARELSDDVIQAETRYQLHLAPEREPDLTFLFGRWFSGSSMGRLLAASNATGQPTPEKPAAERTTAAVQRPRAREEAKLVEKDESRVKQYTLAHNFEKIETLEEFKGIWRDVDGADDLDEHREALDELDLRHVMRSDDPVHSVYDTSFGTQVTGLEVADSSASEPSALRYDEWNYQRQSYAKAHCQVFIETPKAGDAAYADAVLKKYAATIGALRKQFRRFWTDSLELKRQTHGDEPDLDAVIDRFGDLHAHAAVSENVYLSRRRRRRDLAVTVLIDLSLSTDGYADGRRIIDVEKVATLMLGELMHEFGIGFSVAAFSSRTRQHCSYVELKRFSDPWPKVRARVGALSPQGYTRIGPALRHATATLAAEHARRRWVLVLSDGKPNDYDRYEGRYGLEDVRQAVREARQAGVRIFGLAIDARARDYLPLMLGAGGYRILRTPAELPRAMTQFICTNMKA